ncbi:hypothetical protein PQ478_09285 [Alkalihalophilus pseudofirmus]|uniref:hypothetical protein n=1 Tax=Alkalihalophilus pseudofirmus TaxID=79885 RepID=UPI00259B6F11|nr:hypothetical protein [Alkalihalophilus pseudofirmus]WEG18662.1 hypothetical protein PQ478_09285 [Alkalihalophilus pseudofirmus]
MSKTRRKLNEVKELVMSVLAEDEKARSNDTYLYLKCLEKKNVETLEGAYNADLSIVSVHKIRQKIQNKEGLFLPSDKVIEAREELNKEVKNYMVGA